MNSAMKADPNEGKVTWRIYYADETTFDNLMGSPADAPATGVIAIVQKQPDFGFTVTAFKDFYWREHDEWWAGDQAGFWQYMFAGGERVVKFGVSVPGYLFNKIMARATNDQQFGIKSGNSLLEYGNEQGWSDSREIPTS